MGNSQSGCQVKILCEEILCEEILCEEILCEEILQDLLIGRGPLPPEAPVESFDC
jgi:hypothetical protein